MARLELVILESFDDVYHQIQRLRNQKDAFRRPKTPITCKAECRQNAGRMPAEGIFKFGLQEPAPAPPCFELDLGLRGNKKLVLGGVRLEKGGCILKSVKKYGNRENH